MTTQKKFHNRHYSKTRVQSVHLIDCTRAFFVR
nr:MAG TPA: hypothetical protein [Bacteriophage sp.]